MPSVFIKTYGCQMNERDSEAVAAQLVAKGYTLAASEHVADVVLLNTCSVRDNAEQKAINKMENIAGDIRKNRPNVVLGFLGCMAQSRGKELIDRLPDVDLVVGTQKFHRTADYLDEILQGTNTAERQVAARRVILYLVEMGALGAVSTHDLTLADSSELVGTARNVHFTEQVSGGNGAGSPRVHFDYHLRPGIATSTNALKLMDIVFGSKA